MTIDLEKLKALAEKATPGPWFVLRNELDDPDNVLVHGISSDGLHDDIARTDSGAYPPREDDAQYIAAANPQTILAMCEELEAARAMRDGLNIDDIWGHNAEYDQIRSKNEGKE